MSTFKIRNLMVQVLDASGRQQRPRDIGAVVQGALKDLTIAADCGCTATCGCSCSATDGCGGCTCTCTCSCTCTCTGTGNDDMRYSLPDQIEALKAHLRRALDVIEEAERPAASAKEP